IRLAATSFIESCLGLLEALLGAFPGLLHCFGRLVEEMDKDSGLGQLLPRQAFGLATERALRPRQLAQTAEQRPLPALGLQHLAVDSRRLRQPRLLPLAQALDLVG